MPKTRIEDIVRRLRPRLGFLDGVSLGGGEPLLHRELGDFLREMRFQGAKIRVKTNASRPRSIQYMIDEGLLDYIRVFVPAPFSKYMEVVNQRIDIDEVKKSIQIIRKSSVPHEFAVKPVPGLVELNDLMEIAYFLSGSRRLVIERFDPSKVLDPEKCGNTAFSEKELYEMLEAVKPYFGEAVLSP